MLKRQFGWTASSRIVATLLQATAFVVLARTSSPQHLGLVSAIAGVGFFAVALADMGIGTLVLRAGGQHASGRRLRGALRLNMESTVILMILMILTLAGIGTVGDEIYLQTIPLAIWLGLEKSSDIWLNVAIAFHRAGIAAIGLVIRRATALGSVLLFTRLDLPPVEAFSLGMASGAVIGLLSTIFSCRRLIQGDDRTSRTEVFKSSRVYFITNLAGQAKNFDIPIIAALSSGAAAGLYSSAQKLTNPMLTFATSMASVVLPHAASSTRAHVRIFATRIFFVAFGAAICGFLVLGLVGQAFISLIFGAQYSSAGGLLQVLFVAAMFIGCSPIIGSLLQGVDEHRAVAVNSVIFSVVSLVLLGLGASLGGAIGAAWALAIAYMLKVLA